MLALVKFEEKMNVIGPKGESQLAAIPVEDLNSLELFKLLS